MSCDHHNGEGCSLGLFGGNPSPGVCGQCDQYNGKPRGLGDVIHTVAQVTGIAKGIAKLAPGGCGCSDRRRRLNILGKNSSVSGDPADTEAQP